MYESIFIFSAFDTYIPEFFLNLLLIPLHSPYPPYMHIISVPSNRAGMTAHKKIMT